MGTNCAKLFQLPKKDDMVISMSDYELLKEELIGNSKHLLPNEWSSNRDPTDEAQMGELFEQGK